MEIEISKKVITTTMGVMFLILIAYAAVGGARNTDSVKSADVPVTSTILPAKVQIVEFSDFQCPYCARAVPTINALKENYGGAINLIFKHFPLSFHRDAKKAAEASECARDQGKFWEYHDILFQNQNQLKVNDLKRYAQSLGLDTSTFEDCLDGDVKSSIVDRDFAEGRARGVSGTPTFFINGQQVVGAQPYEKFAEIIDIMIEVNSDDSGTDEVQELEEVQPQTAPAGGGSCGGACGSPTCGAVTGGSCGCGG